MNGEPLATATRSELSPEKSHPLAHTQEPVAGSVAIAWAAPGVRDFDLQVFGPVTDGNPGSRRTCVLERVRQRLLDDPVCREIHAGRQDDRLALNALLDGGPRNPDFRAPRVQVAEARLWGELELPVVLP